MNKREGDGGGGRPLTDESQGQQQAGQGHTDGGVAARKIPKVIYSGNFFYSFDFLLSS